MIVQNLTRNSEQYTSNAWHVCGTYHELSDKNTLIDTGRDPSIFEKLDQIKCGLGKKPLEQIILTHSHFDHAGELNRCIQKYHPKVFAHPQSRIAGITPLKDREMIHVGEQDGKIVHTPGHSEDSLCILCEQDKTLFSGDIPIRIYSDDGTYSSLFVEAFELFAASELKMIYPGHGEPLTLNVSQLIDESLRNIHRSTIV
ncbi:MAG: MBL fold metallo-hydrolase [Methanomicrobiales archaeon]|nr:MBL fold metallo-hydrolase [Methanomicrobiales archaeon]